MYNILTLSVHSQIHSEYHNVVRTSVTTHLGSLWATFLSHHLSLQNYMSLQVLCVYLTNRLHFAIVCSVIDTRYDVIMWCGKNKKVGH